MKISEHLRIAPQSSFEVEDVDSSKLSSSPESKLLRSLTAIFVEYEDGLPTPRVRAQLKEDGLRAMNVYFAEKVMQLTKR